MKVKEIVNGCLHKDLEKPLPHVFSRAMSVHLLSSIYILPIVFDSSSLVLCYFIIIIPFF